MIIVDKALARLEAEWRPIRVAVIGAGFQGAAVVRQIVKSTPGMRVVGVANRRGEAAVRAYADVGVEASRVEGRPAIENVLASGGCAATEDAIGLATADGVDVVVELSGSIEYAANVVLRSEEHTSELQSLMRTSYAVFCLKQKKKHQNNIRSHTQS